MQDVAGIIGLHLFILAGEDGDAAPTGSLKAALQIPTKTLSVLTKEGFVCIFQETIKCISLLTLISK